MAHTRNLLKPLETHLEEAGLGSISEIFDGDEPHLPRGAMAQAWSVAELLRVLWQEFGEVKIKKEAQKSKTQPTLVRSTSARN